MQFRLVMQYYLLFARQSFLRDTLCRLRGFLKVNGSEMFADKILCTLTLFLLEVTVYEIEYGDWGVMAVHKQPKLKIGLQ